jgi:hypothetical protein
MLPPGNFDITSNTKFTAHFNHRFGVHALDSARIMRLKISGLRGGRSTSHNLPSAGGTAMQLRVFGRTGMQLSVLGFGCGAVGGLMVCGDLAERTVARAIVAGLMQAE